VAICPKQTTTVAKASDPDMPSMPNRPWLKDDPTAWPARLLASECQIGIVQQKEFPNVKCETFMGTDSYGAHPTRFCEQCKNLVEVWVFVTSEGPCNNSV
jgi:hypothetical protein